MQRTGESRSNDEPQEDPDSVRKGAKAAQEESRWIQRRYRNSRLRSSMQSKNSLLISSSSISSLTVLQPHWPPCCSLNEPSTPGKLPPQGFRAFDLFTSLPLLLFFQTSAQLASGFFQISVHMSPQTLGLFPFWVGIQVSKEILGLRIFGEEKKQNQTFIQLTGNPENNGG